MNAFSSVPASAAQISKDQTTVNRHWFAMPLLSSLITAGTDILCHKAAAVTAPIQPLLVVAAGFAVGGLLTWRAARAHKRLMTAQNPRKMALIEALETVGFKSQSLEENALKTFTLTNLGLAALSSLVGYWAPEAWSAIPFPFSDSTSFDKGIVAGLSGLGQLLTLTASFLGHKDVTYIASRSYEPLTKGGTEPLPPQATAQQGNGAISPPAPQG